MHTIETSLNAVVTAIEDGVSWEGFTLHVWEQHRRHSALEALIGACRQHRGSGLRQARIIRSRALRLLRECRQDGTFNDDDAKDLKQLLDAYERLRSANRPAQATGDHLPVY